MSGQVDGDGDLASALVSSLGAVRLHVVLTVDRRTFDDVASAAGTPSMHDLLPSGQSAVIIGDGGPGFFASFREHTRPPDTSAEAAGASGAGAPAWTSPANPLDDFTREVVDDAVTRAFLGRRVVFRSFFPFADAWPLLPFQRLGRAAGLPAPGPLGLQIHPEFGPWWAYRGLVVLDQEVVPHPAAPTTTTRAAPWTSPCTDCPAPCITACPVTAPDRAGFGIDRCTGRRVVAGSACATACAARSACPVGPTSRYPDEQLAFHMRASFPGGWPHSHGDQAE